MTRGIDHVEMEKIVSLSKRRGFIFPSSEIYGGLASTWDYGPLGVELKRNVKDSWWRTVVHRRDDVFGLDAAILMHPQVWVSSGHVDGFSDPLVECKRCHKRYREDHLEGSSACPSCGGEFTESRTFNLMLKTFLGPVEDSAHQVWMRPETAQGIFVNFQNVVTSTRRKLPFGIAQIGKAFRNEITAGNFVFRTREFEQMEIEFFVKPGTDEEWHDRWIKDRLKWYTDHGIRSENLRIRPHGDDELAHYAKSCYDIEYNFPWGWAELEGIANGTDFDLRQHQKHSGKELKYFDDELQEHYFPYVIEPSGGADRATLAFLVDSYDEEPGTESQGTRTVLHLHPSIAPVKVAVLPLSRNEKLVPKAREVYQQLLEHFVCQYDDAQSIGRRYRRQDEIGTPLAVTIDFDTVEKDDAVTVRDRDNMQQTRVNIKELIAVVTEKLNS